MDVQIYLLIISLVAIASIIAFRYIAQIRRYLKEFINVSSKVSHGDLNAKIDSSYKGDFGKLTSNFNFMIDKINYTIKELEDKNIQLTSIVTSISHGILAIDVDGNIMLINEKAIKIFKYNDKDRVEGKHIRDVIREPIILKEIDTILINNKNIKKEIKINDDLYYQLKMDPIYIEDGPRLIIGSIINIENISEKVRLERMRTDFVANVTHELKTPLTSISGFVETLKINENLDVNTRNRFLSIIETESDRLKRLINDILFLAFVESHEKKHIEPVKLIDVFNEVYDLTIGMATSKNISFNHHFSNNDMILITNRDYIKQIFVNLIDNAIKYTNDGGVIRVYVEDGIDNIKIKVKDTGIGIPKEDINRVFERFYRVDKARSKKAGGTGLGLAIVKHIVKSLDGFLYVNSELNKGSEFIVNIPKRKFPY
jgi:two-component system, OmpR family, phosphate regulon sensor histidine kinase PhoR